MASPTKTHQILIATQSTQTPTIATTTAIKATAISTKAAAAPTAASINTCPTDRPVAESAASAVGEA